MLQPHCRGPPCGPLTQGMRVEEVINNRMRGRRLQYLVRWKGYGYKENLWLSEGDLDTPDLVAEFHKGHLTTPK
jgi:hypothetical protein